MKTILLCLFTLVPFLTKGQTLPYSTLPTYPEEFTAGTVAARAVDGLGFRFYWATEGLREEDLKYKPSADGRTTRETIEHVYEMSFVIINATSNKVNKFGPGVAEIGKNVPFADMRKQILENLKNASDALKKTSDQGMKDLHVIFSDGKKEYSFPFWNLIGGPLEDSIWHTGQVVAFRRASGNPIKESVDYFMGK